MYERRGRLNNRQQTELITFFVAGATARAAGEMAGVTRNTAASCFMCLRRLIASPLPGYRLSGEIEADESYFGGIRKGKRGRGAVGKITVFGLLKRNGRVCTAIIPMPVRKHFSLSSESGWSLTVWSVTDTFSACNALDINGFHHRINHSQKFAKHYNHINGIENFWNHAQRHAALTVSSLNTFTGSSRSANGAPMEATINSFQPS